MTTESSHNLLQWVNKTVKRICPEQIEAKIMQDLSCGSHLCILLYEFSKQSFPKNKIKLNTKVDYDISCNMNLLQKVLANLYPQTNFNIELIKNKKIWAIIEFVRFIKAISFPEGQNINKSYFTNIIKINSFSDRNQSTNSHKQIRAKSTSIKKNQLIRNTDSNRQIEKEQALKMLAGNKKTFNTTIDEQQRKNPIIFKKVYNEQIIKQQQTNVSEIKQENIQKQEDIQSQKIQNNTYYSEYLKSNNIATQIPQEELKRSRYQYQQVSFGPNTIKQQQKPEQHQFVYPVLEQVSQNIQKQKDIQASAIKQEKLKSKSPKQFPKNYRQAKIFNAIFKSGKTDHSSTFKKQLIPLSKQKSVPKPLKDCQKQSMGNYYSNTKYSDCTNLLQSLQNYPYNANPKQRQL